MNSYTWVVRYSSYSQKIGDQYHRHSRGMDWPKLRLLSGIWPQTPFKPGMSSGSAASLQSKKRSQTSQKQFQRRLGKALWSKDQPRGHQEPRLWGIPAGPSRPPRTMSLPAPDRSQCLGHTGVSWGFFCIPRLSFAARVCLPGTRNAGGLCSQSQSARMTWGRGHKLVAAPGRKRRAPRLCTHLRSRGRRAVGCAGDGAGRSGAELTGGPPLLPSPAGGDWQGSGTRPNQWARPGAGPGTGCSGYLESSARRWESRAEPGLSSGSRRAGQRRPGGARAPHCTVQRGVERSRSPTRSPGPTRHRRFRSTHGDHETLKEFGVSGAGKSRVGRSGFLCLGNGFSSSDCLDPVLGRRERGLWAKSGPLYTHMLPPTPTHIHCTGFLHPSPASLLGYFRQSSLALAQSDWPWWGQGKRSKGQSAPAGEGRCARVLGRTCNGERASVELKLCTNVWSLSVPVCRREGLSLWVYVTLYTSIPACQYLDSQVSKMLLVSTECLRMCPIVIVRATVRGGRQPSAKLGGGLERVRTEMGA